MGTENRCFKGESVMTVMKNSYTERRGVKNNGLDFSRASGFLAMLKWLLKFAAANSKQN